MLVNKLSPVAWVCCVTAIWLVCGFAFAAIDLTIDETELETVAHAALAPGQNRVLIAGGSNALAGFVDDQLATELQVPVVNVSLTNEGGDTRVVWAFVRSVARPGDTVVLSMLSFVVDEKPNPVLAAGNNRSLSRWIGPRYHAVDLRTGLWHALPARAPLAALLHGVGAHRKLRWSRYCRTPMGDLLDVSYQPRPPAYWQTVAENVAALQREHVHVIAYLPWLAVAPHQRPDLYKQLEEARDRLQAMHVALLEPDVKADIRNDHSEFCDGRHLSMKGAIIRTHLAAVYLKNRLSPPPAP